MQHSLQNINMNYRYTWHSGPIVSEPDVNGISHMNLISNV